MLSGRWDTFIQIQCPVLSPIIFSKIFLDHPPPGCSLLAHLLLSRLTSYLMLENQIWKYVRHQRFIPLAIPGQHFFLSLSTVTFCDCDAYKREINCMHQCASSLRQNVKTISKKFEPDITSEIKYWCLIFFQTFFQKNLWKYCRTQNGALNLYTWVSTARDTGDNGSLTKNVNIVVHCRSGRQSVPITDLRVRLQGCWLPGRNF